MYAYVKNDLPNAVTVNLTNDGAVFGGGGSGSSSFTAPPGVSTSGSGNFTDGIRVNPYISPFSVGGGNPWSLYYCMRHSPSGFLDASATPCTSANTYKVGADSTTPYGLRRFQQWVVLTKVDSYLLNRATSGRTIGYEVKFVSGSTKVGTLAPGEGLPLLEPVTTLFVKNTASDQACVYQNGSTTCANMLPNTTRSYSQSGSYATYEVDKSTAPICPAQNVNWGTSNFCSGPVAAGVPGDSFSVTNSTTGATGSGTASCSVAGWTVTASSCSASLNAPTGLSATKGTLTGRIDLSWSAIPGASTYRLQYRKTGVPTWTDLTSTASLTHSWTGVADPSVFEFQVRGENDVGNSEWSAIDTGFIRAALNALFISQSNVPLKVAVGSKFPLSQVWRNTGAETWAGAAYGTAPFGAGGAIDWGLGVTAFAGTTATSAEVTSSFTATAPATPGTYTLQRIVQKSGVNLGEPSTPLTVVVVGPPTCSALTTDLSTTFNPNATITATLVGESSVEFANVRVWGDAQGETGAATYAMTFNGTNWVGTFPVAAHLSPGEVKLNLQGMVGNSLFSAASCAGSSVGFQQLPVPAVTLVPTFGTFGDQSLPGFVANRQGGEFAKITIDLGSYSNSLKARVEVIDANNVPLASLNAVTASQPTSLSLSSSVLNKLSSAWGIEAATVRVTYSDAGAASQGKSFLLAISWTAGPGGLSVSAGGVTGVTPTVTSVLNPSGPAFATSTYGSFIGSVRVAADQSSVGAQPVTDTGSWTVSGLDYSQLFATQLVSVARAIPPAGISLFSPLEFTSAPFVLPVQSPLSVVATDGTRENDVQVTWPAIATGSAIRYRVFRDSTEITPSSGINALEVVDVPPVRGTTYSYSVKTLINNVMSQADVTDTGFVPACRAARLIGASMDASMSAINGLVESWECLQGLVGAGRIDALESSEIQLAGQNPKYRRFSFPIPTGMNDGSHTLRATFDSAGVVINAKRTYEIPFVMDRSSITINNLTILYDGSAAQAGLEATSIGRFGIRMDGGNGIGFAEEVK